MQVGGGVSRAHWRRTSRPWPAPAPPRCAASDAAGALTHILLHPCAYYATYTCPQAVAAPLGSQDPLTEPSALSLAPGGGAAAGSGPQAAALSSLLAPTPLTRVEAQQRLLLQELDVALSEHDVAAVVQLLGAGRAVAAALEQGAGSLQAEVGWGERGRGRCLGAGGAVGGCGVKAGLPVGAQNAGFRAVPA